MLPVRCIADHDDRETLVGMANRRFVTRNMDACVVCDSQPQCGRSTSVRELKKHRSLTTMQHPRTITSCDHPGLSGGPTQVSRGKANFKVSLRLLTSLLNSPDLTEERLSQCYHAIDMEFHDTAF